MYWKKIICFANSRKPPEGSCVAGKEIDNGHTTKWVRPISSRVGHAVSDEERGYQNGTLAELLDIVEIPLDAARVQGHQVENHLLNAGYYWKKHGTATWDQVVAAVDVPNAAFWANSHSTYHGLNDKVSGADAVHLKCSLQLLRLNDLLIRVKVEAGYAGNPDRRRVRAIFTVMGERYWLSVTDPIAEEHYLTQPEGDYPLGDAVACISMVEVWNGFAFRVVASIITPQRCTLAAGRP